MKLGVCSTVLKKICRRNGISRWPYRLIRKIDKALEELVQASLPPGAAPGAVDESAQKSMTLQTLRRQIIAQPDIDRGPELAQVLGGAVDFDDEGTGGQHNKGSARSSSKAGGGASSAAGAPRMSSSSGGGVGSSNSGGFWGSHMAHSGTHAAAASAPYALMNFSAMPGGSGGMQGTSVVGPPGLDSSDLDNRLYGGAGGQRRGPPESQRLRVLESYRPEELRTVFPTAALSHGSYEGQYNVHGAVRNMDIDPSPRAVPGLADVSWGDTMATSGGGSSRGSGAGTPTLYKGEHYEWLTGHASLVSATGFGLPSVGADECTGNEVLNNETQTNSASGSSGSSSSSSSSGPFLGLEVFAGGPANDAVLRSTAAYYRRRVHIAPAPATSSGGGGVSSSTAADSAVAVSMPAIDVSNLDALAAASELVEAASTRAASAPQADGASSGRPKPLAQAALMKHLMQMPVHGPFDSEECNAGVTIW